jgi:hypothetical protein
VRVAGLGGLWVWHCGLWFDILMGKVGGCFGGELSGDVCVYGDGGGWAFV